MKIAVIGSGNIGSALIRKLHPKGHHIYIGTRNIDKPGIKELTSLSSLIIAGSIEAAVEQSEVIILAVPFPAILETLNSLKGVEQKIIIETTNAFGKTIPGYDNAAQAIKQITGCLNVAKCFNTAGAENIEQTTFGTLKIDTFTAGDSIIAKQTAQHLAADIGFGNCYDLGGDTNLRH